jgi:hypothetical protein
MPTRSQNICEYIGARFIGCSSAKRSLALGLEVTGWRFNIEDIEKWRLKLSGQVVERTKSNQPK